MPEPSVGSTRSAIEPRTVARVLRDLDNDIKTGVADALVPIPTGFTPLDSVLTGGVRPGDLALIGGTPGIGKTIVSLQWARNMAREGAQVVYACYEHEESALLGRLLALELGDLPHASDDFEMEKLRLGMQEVASGSGRSLAEVLEGGDLVQRAYERIDSYANNLWLVKASSARTGLGELEGMVQGLDGHKRVLFVDYLQKVSVRPEPIDEAEKVTRITEELKDIALRYKLPVVSIVAADKAGLQSKRLRLHHLRGSSALAYEADIVLLLNDKYNCVSKVHLAYDAVRAQTFRDYAVFTLEKNRGGPNLVDLEFRKDFVYYRFDPVGGMVEESLVDERVNDE